MTNGGPALMQQPDAQSEQQAQIERQAHVKFAAELPKLFPDSKANNAGNPYGPGYAMQGGRGLDVELNARAKTAQILTSGKGFSEEQIAAVYFVIAVHGAGRFGMDFVQNYVNNSEKGETVKDRFNAYMEDIRPGGKKISGDGKRYTGERFDTFIRETTGIAYSVDKQTGRVSVTLPEGMRGAKAEEAKAELAQLVQEKVLVEKRDAGGAVTGYEIGEDAKRTQDGNAFASDESFSEALNGLATKISSYYEGEEGLTPRDGLLIVRELAVDGLLTGYETGGVVERDGEAYKLTDAATRAGTDIAPEIVGRLAAALAAPLSDESKTYLLGEEGRNALEQYKELLTAQKQAVEEQAKQEKIDELGKISDPLECAQAYKELLGDGADAKLEEILGKKKKVDKFNIALDEGAADSELVRKVAATGALVTLEGEGIVAAKENGKGYKLDDTAKAELVVLFGESQVKKIENMLGDPGKYHELYDEMKDQNKEMFIPIESLMDKAIDKVDAAAPQQVQDIDSVDADGGRLDATAQSEGTPVQIQTVVASMNEAGFTVAAGHTQTEFEQWLGSQPPQMLDEISNMLMQNKTAEQPLKQDELDAFFAELGFGGQKSGD